jgi:hypothetical protein
MLAYPEECWHTGEMPPKDPTARRKLSADFHAKRKAAGWRKLTIWLDPASLAELEALKGNKGSTDEAIRNAIMDRRSGRQLSDKVSREIWDAAQPAQPVKSPEPKPAPTKHVSRLKGEWRPPGGKK